MSNWMSLKKLDIFTLFFARVLSVLAHRSNLNTFYEIPTSRYSLLSLFRVNHSVDKYTFSLPTLASLVKPRK